VNFKIKLLAQAQARCFIREKEISDQNLDGTSKENALRIFIPPSLIDSDEYWYYVLPNVLVFQHR
jgi:hypothetical protein